MNSCFNDLVGYTSIRCLCGQGERAQDHSMLEYTEEALSLHRQSLYHYLARKDTKSTRS